MTAEQLRVLVSRRAFLNTAGCGVGALALASLVDPALGAVGNRVAPDSTKKDDRWPGVVRPLHFPARAKRVIYLYMAGGMSHLETFDPKPKLTAMHGQPMPESYTKGQPIAQLQNAKLT